MMEKKALSGTTVFVMQIHNIRTTDRDHQLGPFFPWKLLFPLPHEAQ